MRDKLNRVTANRTWVIIAAIAVLGVVIAVGSAVYLLLLRQPTEDDYSQATRQISVVSEQYDKITDAANASAEQTRTSGKLGDDRQLVQAIKDYRKEVEALVDSDVTLNNDVERAMDAFAKDAMKQPQLIEGRTHVVNASILCEPMFAQQGKVLTSSDAAEKSKRFSNQCISAVKPLETASIPEFKKFGQDLKNNAENRIEYLERYWGIFTIFNKDEQKVDAIEKEIRDVAKVIQPPDFEKLSKDYDSDASFKSLKDIVSAKSREN